tara:strand:- start:307 stop:1134 length:828 start_codon:yes stop_codon:yes gene_type:complete
MPDQKKIYKENNDLILEALEKARLESNNDDWETHFWTTTHLQSTFDLAQLFRVIDEQGQGAHLGAALMLLIIDFCEKPALQDYNKYLEFNKILEDIIVQKPCMSEKELSIIGKYLSKDTMMLEWGSGYSTLYFRKHVKEIHSIEHCLMWALRVNIYKTLLQDKNTFCHYLPPLQEHNGGLAINEHCEERKENYKNYIAAPEKIKENYGVDKYDVVFIDGRVRECCAESILPYLHEDSVVFLHDFIDREDYSVIFDWYDEIERSEEDNSLVVLKKK